MDNPEKKGPQPRTPRRGGRFPSDVLRANVRTLRDARGLSQQDLADRMAELGHSWHQTTAGRIERGARGVSAEEAVSLAVALETTVVGLLDPMAGEAPEDNPQKLARDYYANELIDLGRSVKRLLPPHVARRLILNEHNPWDTTQRSGLVLWRGNKVVNTGTSINDEDGLAWLRRDLLTDGVSPERITVIIDGLQQRQAARETALAPLREAATERKREEGDQ